MKAVRRRLGFDPVQGGLVERRAMPGWRERLAALAVTPETVTPETVTLETGTLETGTVETGAVTGT